MWFAPRLTGHKIGVDVPDANGGLSNEKKRVFLQIINAGHTKISIKFMLDNNATRNTSI